MKKRRIEKKNRMASIYYELFDIYIYIYTFHIEEDEMNKKFKVSLICGSVKLKSKSLKKQRVNIQDIQGEKKSHIV